MAVRGLGIPLRGMVRDDPGKRLPPEIATNLRNFWAESGELRTRYGLSPFANTPQSIPVQQLINAEFGDGTRDVFRIDGTKTYFYDGTNWTEITGTRDFTGGGFVPFGWTGAHNRLVFSNGIAADGIWQWDGSSGTRTEITGGVIALGSPAHAAVRYLTTFKDRVIGAYTNDAQGANTLIGSAIGSTTDWTTVNGAFVMIRNEHPSAITGLSADDNEIYVWKERAVVTGRATGIESEPIVWSMLRTEGIGLIAPFSLTAYGGFNFGLSHEGFFVMRGGQPQFIDSAIKRDFFRRVNYLRLRQVRSLCLPEHHKILWFVPVTNQNYAATAWVYDILNDAWDTQQFLFPVSAAARVFISVGAQVVDSYNVIPTHYVDGGSLSGSIVDSFGPGSAIPAYLFGGSSGITSMLDFTVDRDRGSQFNLEWVTSDVTWTGLEDEQVGRLITARDIMTLDHIEIEYKHLGSPVQVDVAVSTNGGTTYTPLGTQQFVQSNELYSLIQFWGRVSGRQMRFRVTIAANLGFPIIRSFTAYASPTGEVR